MSGTARGITPKLASRISLSIPRGHLWFLGVFVLGLSAFGYVAIKVSEQGPFFLQSFNLEINHTLNSFQEKHKPLAEINFTSLYGGSGHIEVLYPLLDMSSSGENEKTTLKSWSQGIQMPSIASRLNVSEMEELIRGAPLVLTKDYLLLQNQSRIGFSPLQYWVYDIRTIREWLKKGKYELETYIPGSFCLQQPGNACWTYNSKHTMAYLYRYSMTLLLLTGLVVFICLGLYLKYIYEKNKKQQKQRLALQVMSHEFRTPVSSMLMMLDQLSKRLPRFEEADQDLITRISTEVFRLQRIIEISKTYLQTESHRVHFKYVEIPSINNWISDFSAETNSLVQCELLTEDRSVKADPFWLKFVLSNLVQNAFVHGKPPVFIRLDCKNNRMKITVEDQGECEFESLNEMTDAFIKSSRSKGMGLGLNITKFILDDWGTEIRFSKAPTSFTLILSEQM